MAEPDGIQDSPEKTATVTRERRRLYESLPVEEEALTRVIEENKIGKEVLDGGNGVKPVLSGPLRANARLESRAIAKRDCSLEQSLARRLALDPITTKGDQL